ncbi:MAG: hypothetical protein JW722_06400 [Demequinaceae bacterium]|nr:hypothetical protein [Demequinaceae bacterium]
MGPSANDEVDDGGSPDGVIGPSVVDRVARAIGTAHEELWPIRRSNQPRLPSEVMYAHAATAALAVAREAVEEVEVPRAPDGADVEAYRRAILGALGGVG